MLSKEEYKERYYELSQRFFSLFDFLDDDVTEREIENIGLYNMLIDDYFELKERYSKILDDVHDYRFETHCMKMTIRNLCEHFGVKSEKELQNIYLNKPYKLEDLKEDMWVWDNVAKECLYVVRPFITTGVRVKYFTCLGIWNLEKIKKLNIKFEENRFFPVQCANLIKMGVKDDGTQKSTDD